jgi:hypothetical protein
MLGIADSSRLEHLSIPVGARPLVGAHRCAPGFPAALLGPTDRF